MPCFLLLFLKNELSYLAIIDSVKMFTVSEPEYNEKFAALSSNQLFAQVCYIYTLEQILLYTIYKRR
jgi:hypothetical protein